MRLAHVFAGAWATLAAWKAVLWFAERCTPAHIELDEQVDELNGEVEVGWDGRG